MVKILKTVKSFVWKLIGVSIITKCIILCALNITLLPFVHAADDPEDAIPQQAGAQDLQCRYAQLGVSHEFTDHSSWAKKNLNEFEESYGYLKGLSENEEEDKSKKNIATFQLSLTFGGALLTMDYSNCVFLSGASDEYTGLLNSRTKNERRNKIFFSMDDYHPEKKKESSTTKRIEIKGSYFGFRQELADYFDFKDSLTLIGGSGKREKEIQNEFLRCLGNESLLEDMTLREHARENIATSLVSCLKYRFFDKESNKKAHVLGFIDKAHKGVNQENLLDQVFGNNFKLNFTDSEQAIRLFILAPKEDPKTTNRKMPKHFKNELTTDLGLLFRLSQDYLKPGQSDRDKNSIKDEFSNQLTQLVAEYATVGIVFCSYYDMCGNCRATYNYDFEVRKHIGNAIVQRFLTTFMLRDLFRDILCDTELYPEKSFNSFMGCVKSILNERTVGVKTFASIYSRRVYS